MEELIKEVAIQNTGSTECLLQVNTSPPFLSPVLPLSLSSSSLALWPHRFFMPIVEWETVCTLTGRG